MAIASPPALGAPLFPAFCGCSQVSKFWLHCGRQAHVVLQDEKSSILGATEGPVTALQLPNRASHCEYEESPAAKCEVLLVSCGSLKVVPYQGSEWTVLYSVRGWGRSCPGRLP